MRATLAACGARVVASYSWPRRAHGSTTVDPAAVRGRGHADDPRVRRRRRGRETAGLAGHHRRTTPRLAFAFALRNSEVASVLFGATRRQQVEEKLGFELTVTVGRGAVGRVLAIGQAAAH